MKFSDRYGYTRVRDVVQLESMDDALRNSLWSLLKVHVWDHASVRSDEFGRGAYLDDQELSVLCRRVWFNLFKKPLDEMPRQWPELLGVLRAHFFNAEWFGVYNFMEFVLKNYERYQFEGRFRAACNEVLQ